MATGPNPQIQPQSHQRSNSHWAQLIVRIGEIGIALTVIWTVLSIRDLQNKEADHDFDQWQEAALFELIVKSGTGGDTFDNLYQRYKDEGRYGASRPHRKLTRKTFDAVMVSLISKRVILPLGTNRYKLLSDSELNAGGHCGYDVVNKLTGRALEELQVQNGKLDQYGVMRLFFEKFREDNVSSGDCQLLLYSMFQARMLGTHKTTKKVWNLIARNDMRPQCESGFVPEPMPDPKLQRRAARREEFTPRPYDPSSDIGEAKPQVLPEGAYAGPYQRIPRRKPSPMPNSTPPPVAN
jgi:hypothetical protein